MLRIGEIYDNSNTGLFPIDRQGIVFTTETHSRVRVLIVYIYTKHIY